MNTFGRIFRLSLFGESHGAMLGVLLDGVPAGISVSEEIFRADLFRRKAGAKGTTPRLEADIPILGSGLFNGKTTGAPLLISFLNENIQSRDYSQILAQPRPGHADYTSSIKYGGFSDYRGGGHFSGRLTLGLVAAGVIAKAICKPIQIKAELIEAGGRKDIESAIDAAIELKDSIGGIVQCTASGLPVGFGEPFFDSIESVISHLAFSVPAIKGIEFGSGFYAASMRGSEHNDAFLDEHGKTGTNHAGGINGGISNGNDLVFRVAVKPTSSIGKTQNTYHLSEETVKPLSIEGRHDVCIALRVPVVIEAITAIALADFLLLSEVGAKFKIPQ